MLGEMMMMLATVDEEFGQSAMCERMRHRMTDEDAIQRRHAAGDGDQGRAANHDGVTCGYVMIGEFNFRLDERRRRKINITRGDDEITDAFEIYILVIVIMTYQTSTNLKE